MAKSSTVALMAFQVVLIAVTIGLPVAWTTVEIIHVEVMMH